MSLTNPNKVITEERLKEFYDGILPYLGGMPEMVANKFSKSDIYSTDEKMVGQWTDGKPIYQKVLTGTMPTVTTDGTEVTKNIAIGATVDKCISVEAYINNTNGITLPIYNRTSDTARARINVPLNSSSDSSQKNTVAIKSSATAWNGLPVTVIIKYTKTTDSAISIGNETDYSTTEKIVGTWIDGKPIYQKTIPITLPTCTTDGTEVSASFAIGASIDTVVDVNAWYVLDAKVSFIFTSTGVSTKYVRLLVQTNAYATTADRNKLRISSASKSVNGCKGYATIQYTKTT